MPNRSRIFFFTQKFFFLTLFTLAGARGATAGDEVNNGGGAAQRSVIAAAQDLPRAVHMCVQSPACRLNATESALLRRIDAGLRGGEHARVIFATGQQQNFHLDGEFKIAKTGSTPNSPIYINTELLVARDSLKRPVVFSYTDAIALLTHEEGHHYGSATHEALDILGEKVSRLFSRHVISTPLVPNVDSLRVTVVNAENPAGQSPQVYLAAFDSLLDISNVVRARVFCPKARIPIPFGDFPDINLVGFVPSGISLSNVHWASVKSKNGGKRLELEVVGNLELLCKNAVLPAIETNRNHQLKIKFNVDINDKGEAYIDPRQAKVSQFSNPWWKIFNIPFFF